jgi:hypothetical protein
MGVDVENIRSSRFYAGNTLKRNDSIPGTVHVYNYGLQAVKWKVVALGNILTVRDSCTAATFALAE